MARKRYDIVFTNQMWHVTHARITLSSHNAKQSAIDAGVRIAKDNQPSQLVIHRADGTIEDERTYGDDPFPPRG